jgi:hypothetical protein
VYRKAATLEQRIIDRQFIFVFFILPKIFRLSIKILPIGLKILVTPLLVY